MIPGIIYDDSSLRRREEAAYSVRILRSLFPGNADGGRGKWVKKSKARHDWPGFAERCMMMWGLLPAAPEGFIQIDECQLTVAQGIAHADLGIEVGTLRVEQVHVADGSIDVLQLCEFEGGA